MEIDAFFIYRFHMYFPVIRNSTFPGKYVRTVFRFPETIFGSRNTKKRFLEMLETAFKGLCLRVALDREPTPNTDMADFVEKLRENNSLFFGQVGTM